MALQAQRALRDARERFGPGTPPAIRREAAAILRGAGFSFGEIEAVFGTSRETIRLDLRSVRPRPSAQDAPQATEELAHRRQ